MAKTTKKLTLRNRRRTRIRKNLRGSGARPRLAVYRSSNHIYAQVIDDDLGTTLAAASSVRTELPAAPDDSGLSGKQANAWGVGQLIAQAAKGAGVGQVIFDRGGFLYHGRVAALAAGARAGGLEF
jgi:large subunit ribosomal protein L18